MIKKVFKKLKNSFFMSSRSGQSLIEILISLAIGALLIGAATLGIAFMIRSTATNQRLQVASGIARDLVEKTRSWSASNWQNMYSLEKGDVKKYFLVATGTTFSAILGEEGMLENEVRVGLVGKWGFDESTGTIAYDTAGSGNNGSFVGSFVRATSTDCRVGRCLNFDGTSNYIAVPDSSGLDITNTFAISFWMKSGSLSQSTKYIVSKLDNNGSDNMYSVIYGYVANQIQFYDSSGSLFGYPLSNSNIPILDTNWHHIVYSFNGSAFTGYLDGVPISSVVTSANFSSSTGVFNIGSFNGTGHYFNGFLDDVRLYNRGLTATEVKNLAESKTFWRSFSVQNTCRKLADNTIVATSTCTGDYFQDPSTQAISVLVNWQGLGKIAELKLSEYITRWKNEILHDDNWSGGAGQEGPITVPNGMFASSSLIDVNSYGVIRVKPQ